jgi:hypothetical protein
VNPAQPQEFSLNLRVPGWCKGWSLSINGATGDLKPQANGYLSIERKWQTGDVMEFEMEMPIQAVWAHPAVRYLEGRVALQRGPLVYCLEGIDHQNIILDRIALQPKEVQSGQFQTHHRDDFLGGVTVLRGKGQRISDSGWENSLYRNEAPATETVEITAIPYYAWDNRAPGEMRLWLREI